MNALILSLLLAGSADDLASTRVHGLRLKAPAAWTRTDVPDGVRYDSPSKDAWLELNVMKVEPKRAAKKCIDELVEKLGEGWTHIKVGGHPALEQVNTAKADADHEEEQPIHVEVKSVTFIGCNGATKWVMTVAANKKQEQRYDKLIQKILQSITYAK